MSLWFLLVALYSFDKAKQCIGTMTIEIDFLQKKNIDSNPYDTDKMAAEFIQQFNNQAFSVGQQVGTSAPTPSLCREPNAGVQGSALEEL